VYDGSAGATGVSANTGY